jgi:predicted Zn-dependent protease with MMP-like domain
MISSPDNPPVWPKAKAPSLEEFEVFAVEAFRRLPQEFRALCADLVIPILDYWAEHDETLGAIVTHVLVHEIGHHFGLSDDDMEDIEASAE